MKNFIFSSGNQWTKLYDVSIQKQHWKAEFPIAQTFQNLRVFPGLCYKLPCIKSYFNATFSFRNLNYTGIMV